MIYLKDEIINSFIEEAIPKLEIFETINSQCQCGRIIEMPIIVSKEHYDAFKTILDIACKYLVENKVQEKALKELMDQINKRLNIQ